MSRSKYADCRGHVDRMARARDIVESRLIRKIDESHYAVRSQSKPDKEYEVNIEGLVCDSTCPDFQYRGMCAHLLAVALQCYGQYDAEVLYQRLTEIKAARDSAIAESHECEFCHGETKLVGLSKLGRALDSAIEIYTIDVACQQCHRIKTVRVQTKRRTA